MPLCINPQCQSPQNPDDRHFCQACGSELLLQFRYRVVKAIGKGGFGQTYEALDGSTPRVLKVLINTSAKAVELFQREAEVLKQLNQPSIPRVEADGYFTFLPKDGQQPLHCLVMEKITGLNLWDYIRELGRPIDAGAAKRWLVELITTLQPLHERGILHRDIKPQNIILRTDGKLALIDFGAIKEGQDTEIATAASGGSEGTELATKTRGRTSIQSPGYTPNEQMNGQAILPQSDFYALSRTFIYLLTTREPKNLDYDHLEDKLLWRQYAPNISPELADLIDHMGATLVRERPRTSQEVLQQLVDQGEQSASQSSQPRPAQQKTGNSFTSTHSVPSTPQNTAVALNLTLQLPLTPSEMKSGVEKQIEVEGEKINVNIPAGVSEGTQVRIRGKGRFNSSTQTYGNLIIGITAAPQTTTNQTTQSTNTPSKFEQHTPSDNIDDIIDNDFASQSNTPIDLDLTTSIKLTPSEMQNGVEKCISVSGETLNVRIPAGAKPGSKVRVRGKGRWDSAAQKRGDLYLDVVATSEGNADLDLAASVELTPSEMQNGAQKCISVSGETLNVQIPAGVSVGKRIRLRGKGKFDPVTQRRGDLYLEVTETSKVDGVAPSNPNYDFSSYDSLDDFVNDLLTPLRGSKVIGIDLGTTKSVVSVMVGGKPTIIPNAQKQRGTPTIVAYTSNGQCLTGDAAKRQAYTNPENTFYWFTHLLGCDYSEVADVATKVAYQIQDNEGKASIWCPALGQSLAPEEILSRFLRQLAKDAEQYMETTVTQVVISVPIHFNLIQYEMVIEAARLAGLECIRLIPQSIAAAISYGLDKKSNETTLIFDMGGGSCNVSLFDIEDGVFETLACAGNVELGGDDFDKKIVNYLIERFRKVEGIDLSKNEQALTRLTEATEKAKIELSSATRTEINLPFITATQDGPKHLDITLTRVKFEELCSDLFDACRVLIQTVLLESKQDKNNIDEIVLMGGSTRIPAIQTLITRLLEKQPNQRLNREETVAMGVAVQAGVLAGEVKDTMALDVLTASLGVETLGGEMSIVIPRNTTIPTKKSEVFSTAEDNQNNVEIHIVQGEAAMVAQNKSLGKFRINDIPPAPKGVPQIEVTFEVYAGGKLQVDAKDKESGKEWSWSPRLNIADNYYSRGSHFFNQGQFENAMAQYHLAIQINPNHANAYTEMGYILHHEDKLNEAVTAYRQAIRIDSNNSLTHHNLGVALLDQGKLDEAIAGFRQAIQINPSYALAYNNLGVALEAQGKQSESKEAYRRAKQLGYTG